MCGDCCANDSCPKDNNPTIANNEKFGIDSLFGIIIIVFDNSPYEVAKLIEYVRSLYLKVIKKQDSIQ